MHSVIREKKARGVVMPLGVCLWGEVAWLFSMLGARVLRVVRSLGVLWRRGVLGVALLWVAAGVLRAQPTEQIYFLLNGQVCTEGYFILYAGDATWAYPVRVSLGGYMPGLRAVHLEIYSTRCAEQPPLSCAYPRLVYGEERLLPGKGVLRVPFSNAPVALGSGKALWLHLNAFHMPIERQVITLHARSELGGEVLAKLNILVQSRPMSPASSVKEKPVQQEVSMWRKSSMFRTEVLEESCYKVDLSFLSQEETCTVEVVDLLGVKIREYQWEGGGEEQTLLLSELKPGVYFVRISVGGVFVQMKRLVVAPRPVLLRSDNL